MLGTVFTWRCSLPLGGDVSFGEIQQMGMLWFRLTAHVFCLDRLRGTSHDFGNQNSSAKHWKGRETWRWKEVLEVHMKGYQVRFWNCTNSTFSHCLNSVAAKFIKNKSGWTFPQVAETHWSSAVHGAQLWTPEQPPGHQEHTWTPGTDLDTRNRSPGHGEQISWTQGTTSWTPHYWQKSVGTKCQQ